jgi:hypothetical protein
MFIRVVAGHIGDLFLRQRRGKPRFFQQVTYFKQSRGFRRHDDPPEFHFNLF